MNIVKEGRTVPRKGHTQKRDVLADPIYNNKVVTKLINNIMLDGKRGVAQKIVYGAFDRVAAKTERPAIEVFEEAMNIIVTELMSSKYLDVFNEKVDLIQIGARNMQNFDLLKELGQVDRPILLKRGLNATYEEWIMSAEYIMASGNENVILCERGIRTFETFTRNTLDLQCIPVLRSKTHLPIVIDPSHAGGKWWLVEPMAKAAVAAGADGLMIEVHNNPEAALCDGAQSLKPEKYDVLLQQVRQIAEVVGKKF